MAIPAHLCSAKEAAEILGIKVARLYQIKAQLGGSRYGNEGVLFDRTLVLERKARRAITSGATGGSSILGTTASIVFRELEAGKSPVRIVIEKSISPDVVRSLAAQHAELNESILLTRDILEQLYKMPGTSGITSCKTAADFMLLYADSVKLPERCRHCSRPSKQYVTPLKMVKNASSAGDKSANNDD
jgi:hypothetical protein